VYQKQNDDRLNRLQRCMIDTMQWRHWGGGRTAPCDTFQGVTLERKKIFVGEFHRIVEKRGGTGKKDAG